MTIERIFSELNSREFQFIMNGVKYKLPHLNTMKPEILRAYKNQESAGQGGVQKYKLALEIFRSTDNEDFIKKIPKMTQRELLNLFDEWWEWSGVMPGKFIGTLSLIEKHTNAFEMDLLFFLKMTFAEFFTSSIRTQANIMETMLKESDSFTVTDRDGLEYRWGIDRELQAQEVENFVNVNTKSEAPTYKIPRPHKKSPTKPEMTETKMKEIRARLTPVFDR